MIGMVLVTHGRLAAEFVAALEHVVGPQSQIAAVCIGPEDDMEQRRQDILQLRSARSTAATATVLLTDMFGGTPSNLAISVMDRGKVEVIAGVNLPMLIKLASLRQNERLERAVLGAQEAGPQIHQCRLAAAGRRAPMNSDARQEPSRSRGADAVPQRGERVKICNQRGLHARAAARFVKTAAQFEAEIWVRKNGTAVSGPFDHGADDAGRRVGRTVSRSPPPDPMPTTAVETLARLIECKFDED